MRILVDADGCPVKNIVIKIAKEYDVNVIMFTDICHVIKDDYSEVITVDKGRDSVDMALINRLEKNDIVVTQDYGLASLVLPKGGHPINQNGFLYTNENIDGLLFQRFLSQKVRKAGGRTPHHKKRKHEDDVNFEKSFKELVSKVIDL